MKNEDEKPQAEVTLEEFCKAASIIVHHHHNPESILTTLVSVCKKTLNEDDKYRLLDLTNQRVVERLIGYRGVLEFLALLGYKSDALATKYICHRKPSNAHVDKAIASLGIIRMRWHTVKGLAKSQICIQVPSKTLAIKWLTDLEVFSIAANKEILLGKEREKTGVYFLAINQVSMDDLIKSDIALKLKGIKGRLHFWLQAFPPLPLHNPKIQQLEYSLDCTQMDLQYAWITINQKAEPIDIDSPDLEEKMGQALQRDYDPNNVLDEFDNPAQSFAFGKTIETMINAPDASDEKDNDQEEKKDIEYKSDKKLPSQQQAIPVFEIDSDADPMEQGMMILMSKMHKALDIYTKAQEEHNKEEIDKKAMVEYEHDALDKEQEELKKWLTKTVKLPQYFDTFISNAVDDLDTASLLTTTALEKMGINLIGHQLKIMRKVRMLNNRDNLSDDIDNINHYNVYI